MIGLLVDHNIERHGELLWKQFAEADWHGMEVSSVQTVIEAGLERDATDREVWLFCQRQNLLLLTANRNRRGDDSLQAVLDSLNTPLSLPVLTLSNANRVLIDANYRELCAYRIADVALEIQWYLGTARLFVP